MLLLYITNRTYVLFVGVLPNSLYFKPILTDLDDLFNIDNPYFEGLVNQIYPPELQPN